MDEGARPDPARPRRVVERLAHLVNHLRVWTRLHRSQGATKDQECHRTPGNRTLCRPHCP
jgi:hypothetical protein